MIRVVIQNLVQQVFINDLEKVIVTNEDVDNGLCCAICQDYFKMGERAIKLPCKVHIIAHLMHLEDICGVVFYHG